MPSNERLTDFARWNVRRSDSGLYLWKMDPAARHVDTNEPDEDEPWRIFRSIQCPLLVLRASDSDILSRETADRMKEEHNDTTIIEVPGAVHPPLLTEPETAASLKSFLPS